MSDLLRAHIDDFGFKHAEISRRASKLNQATTYRVVEGETTNPSLNSITGIIEAISLTDADAGVLYRKMGVSSAKPRLLSASIADLSFDSVKTDAKNNLDRGRIRDAAHNVMAMFDLAENDDQLYESYEQAGIVYMGLGRWEEAQVNFEAADAHLHCDLDDPATPQKRIDRKHTLMTNIGSLMVKRNNTSWATLFGKAVVSHPRANALNRGWGYLVIGEAALNIDNVSAAHGAFQAALLIFQSCHQRAVKSPKLMNEVKERQIQQAMGNCRWAEIHLLKSELHLGCVDAGEMLKQKEADWWSIDPEASTMAGLFHAEHLKDSNRRGLLLRDLKARSKRHGLGEIAQRIANMLCLCLLVGSSLLSSEDNPRLAGPYDLGLKAVQVKHANCLDSIDCERGPKPLNRGNTGG